MAQERVFPAWLSFFLDNGLRKLRQDPEKILKGLIREGDTAADIGCGPGYFTFTMAEMAGAGGRAIACDVQEKMLAIVAKKRARTGPGINIEMIRAVPGGTGIKDKLDFALCFAVVHEMPDIPGFFRELAGLLKPGGRALFAEPAGHVSESGFKNSLQAAAEAGLKTVETRNISGSRAVLLGR